MDEKPRFSDPFDINDNGFILTDKYIFNKDILEEIENDKKIKDKWSKELPKIINPKKDYITF